MLLGFDRRRRSSFSDDGALQRRQQANATTVKATTTSKSDDEQAKATSTANDLVATTNDSARSSRMGIGKRLSRRRGCRKWDRRDGEIVANGIVRVQINGRG